MLYEFEEKTINIPEPFTKLFDIALTPSSSWKPLPRCYPLHPRGHQLPPAPSQKAAHNVLRLYEEAFSKIHTIEKLHLVNYPIFERGGSTLLPLDITTLPCCHLPHPRGPVGSKVAPRSTSCTYRRLYEEAFSEDTRIITSVLLITMVKIFLKKKAVDFVYASRYH